MIIIWKFKDSFGIGIKTESQKSISWNHIVDHHHDHAIEQTWYHPGSHTLYDYLLYSDHYKYTIQIVYHVFHILFL